MIPTQPPDQRPFNLSHSHAPVKPLTPPNSLPSISHTLAPLSSSHPVPPLSSLTPAPSSTTGTSQQPHSARQEDERDARSDDDESMAGSSHASNYSVLSYRAAFALRQPSMQCSVALPGWDCLASSLPSAGRRRWQCSSLITRNRRPILTEEAINQYYSALRRQRSPRRSRCHRWVFGITRLLRGRRRRRCRRSYPLPMRPPPPSSELRASAASRALATIH